MNPRRFHQQASFAAILIGLCLSPCAAQTPARASRAGRPTQLNIDWPGLIGRSDIVLGQPNRAALQALPLGNGRLGAAVWSAEGLTVQLNRGDTLPFRYATGQVVVPGLEKLVAAPDYQARLNLYDGSFEEHGGGMAVRVYVQPGNDTLVIEIAGADPEQVQTATLRLWEPRKPQASAAGAQAMLAESWQDNREPGASGKRFGSLAAITADGRNVLAAVATGQSVSVRFKPHADGSFRLVVASPEYHGDLKAAQRSVSAALADRDPAEHRAWWHRYWQRADFMKVSSQDGSGEYMEALRAIYLFSAAAESGGEYPGSQAGEADLFASAQDQHQWDPGAFWHWNLRMQVAANLGAGVPELNAPYFRLYRNNLAQMKIWTHDRMQGAPGICIPETMRFNGNGIEFERWGGNTDKVTGWNCDAASKPYYNARTLTTGAEVSVWIWRQYLATGDRSFLAENFPVMAESARFLLAYEKPGADGLLHTSPTNAHETQWDVSDSTTDLAARRTLYAVTIEAANLLGREPELVAQMQTDLKKAPAWPRVVPAAPSLLLADGDHGGGKDILAASYQPAASAHNVENIGLEPVWPYEQIGDASPLFEVAQRTYAARRNRYSPDWSFDAVDAARLQMGEEVRSALIAVVERYQGYINGFNDFDRKNGEFYVEQSAMTALALQEALVQDYDGTIRLAPAVPAEWDFEGRVSVQKGTRVTVQASKGSAVRVQFETATAQTLKVRNPWPGQSVTIVQAGGGVPVRSRRSGSGAFAVIAFEAQARTVYEMAPAGQAGDAGFPAITGQRSDRAKVLGPAQIGLPRALDVGSAAGR
jgi:hypothetical protein